MAVAGAGVVRAVAGAASSMPPLAIVTFFRLNRNGNGSQARSLWQQTSAINIFITLQDASRCGRHQAQGTRDKEGEGEGNLPRSSTASGRRRAASTKEERKTHKPQEK